MPVESGYLRQMQIGNAADFFSLLGQETAKLDALVAAVAAGSAGEELDFLILRRIQSLVLDQELRGELLELSRGEGLEDLEAALYSSEEDCPLAAWVGCSRAAYDERVEELRRRGLLSEDGAALTTAGEAEWKRLYRLLVDVVPV